MKILKLVLLMMLVTNASAEIVSISADPVTTRQDGSTITGAVDYLLYKNGDQFASSSVLPFDVEAATGDRLCLVARETRQTAVDVSPIVDSACADLVALPNPPTNVRIQIVFEL